MRRQDQGSCLVKKADPGKVDGIEEKIMLHPLPGQGKGENRQDGPDSGNAPYPVQDDRKSPAMQKASRKGQKNEQKQGRTQEGKQLSGEMCIRDRNRCLYQLKWMVSLSFIGSPFLFTSNILSVNPFQFF